MRVLNLKEKTIIHVDMDAFYASVEQADNPQLKGKPVIVGGRSSRGVVSTCSYEAREYGIHSAMPCFIAKQLCPDGIFVPGRHKRYVAVSKDIFNILKSITPRVEEVSIDEAYLDVSEIDSDPIDIVRDIKSSVYKKFGLTLSAGISYNKFLAKVASDWNKPNGLMVITKDMIPDILKPLPIKKVHGIGEKSIKRLNSIGIYKIYQLLNLDEEEMGYYFGKYGIEIYNRIRGIDNRAVSIDREIKSLGRETTLSEDTVDKSLLKRILENFAKELGKNLEAESFYIKTVTVKIKTNDFKVHTRSRTQKEYLRDYNEIKKIAFDIIDNYRIKKSIRLIGLSLSNISNVSYEQLSFFD